tara:strand:+ start:673 stop:1089 length:417 start_codon:yes stop_codon:yes gene_type:complete
MNFKMSSREKLLIKILGILIFLTLFFYVEKKLIENIINSKNELKISLERFNENKQLLSQLKDYEQNLISGSQTLEFSELLRDANYSYQQEDTTFRFEIDNQDALFALLNLCEQNRIIPNTIQFSTETNPSFLILILDD